MQVLFCSDPLYPSRPDRTYDTEVQAATAAGLQFSLIDYEKLVNENDVTASIRRVRGSAETEIALYRGWMLRMEVYATLYEGLAERGVQLINTPEAYRHCHYLPESYSIIAAWTPRTVYLPLDLCWNTGIPDMEIITDHLAVFGDKPLILKDYVKSRKHDWAEACYIPRADDRAAVERVVKRFVELQGSEINEGFVFREFIELQRIGTHAKSGMPLTREYRLFFLDNCLLQALEYWDQGEYDGVLPPVEQFVEVAQNVQSRFFTMDIAQKTDGSWLIIELGDGQVAGLPNEALAPAFYGEIAARLPEQ